ncbi:MAG: hypothetical protein AAFO94_21985 [Bacteroidota bacterium]
MKTGVNEIGVNVHQHTPANGAYLRNVIMVGTDQYQRGNGACR